MIYRIAIIGFALVQCVQVAWADESRPQPPENDVPIQIIKSDENAQNKAVPEKKAKDAKAEQTEEQKNLLYPPKVHDVVNKQRTASAKKKKKKSRAKKANGPREKSRLRSLRSKSLISSAT